MAADAVPAGGGPLRVLHVVRQFSPSVGGLEEWVLDLVRRSRDTFGTDAEVLTLDRVFTAPAVRLPRRDTVSGVPVRRIPWAGSSRYPLAPGVLRHLGDADLVHVHAIDFFFDALALSAPLHRRRLVCTTHGGFFHTAAQQRLKRIWFNTATRASARAYAAIVACGPSDAAMFAPVAGDRLVTIANGADIGKWAGLASPVPTRRLVTIGRFASHKRIPHLFRLLACLHRTHPDWSLLVAGAPGDVPLARLQEAATGAGVAHAVQFMPGASDAEIAAALPGCSYFASASAHEGFGLAAVEALSAGLLPVLSAIGPFADLVRTAGQGLLFDPGQPEEAAFRLEALEAAGGATPARRTAAMAAAAGYGRDATASAYHRLYRRVSRGVAARDRAVPAAGCVG